MLDVDRSIARDVYGVDLILLRPDLHIVWRGNALPRDLEPLAACVTGHGAQIPAVAPPPTASTALGTEP